MGKNQKTNRLVISKQKNLDPIFLLSARNRGISFSLNNHETSGYHIMGALAGFWGLLFVNKLFYSPTDGGNFTTTKR